MTVFYAYSREEDALYERGIYVQQKRMTVTIDSSHDVRIDDREVGTVQLGDNGEWYFVSLARSAEAAPIRGLDNASGTGSRSPEAAVCEWFELRRTT